MDSGRRTRRSDGRFSSVMGGLPEKKGGYGAGQNPCDRRKNGDTATTVHADRLLSARFSQGRYQVLDSLCLRQEGARPFHRKGVPVVLPQSLPSSPKPTGADSGRGSTIVPYETTCAIRRSWGRDDERRVSGNGNQTRAKTGRGHCSEQAERRSRSEERRSEMKGRRDARTSPGRERSPERQEKEKGMGFLLARLPCGRRKGSQFRKRGDEWLL